MVRHRRQCFSAVRRSPHPRGDGPVGSGEATGIQSFSPPAWGWSAALPGVISPQPVLPTRVGMVRTHDTAIPRIHRSPHPRGDGPHFARWCRNNGKFSPPAWGWSDQPHLACPGQQVLPTRVGMVRSGSMAASLMACSPHPRGDGPVHLLRIDFRDGFSPPAWGWSGLHRRAAKPHVVLPTRVGMVRNFVNVTVTTLGSSLNGGVGRQRYPTLGTTNSRF